MKTAMTYQDVLQLIVAGCLDEARAAMLSETAMLTDAQVAALAAEIDDAAVLQDEVA